MTGLMVAEFQPLPLVFQATYARLQKEHYSGQKTHTDKTLLLINETTRKVGYLGPTIAGTTHDKKVADEAKIAYPLPRHLHAVAFWACLSALLPTVYITTDGQSLSGTLSPAQSHHPQRTPAALHSYSDTSYAAFASHGKSTPHGHRRVG
jgi:hypothetical protein